MWRAFRYVWALPEIVDRLKEQCRIIGSHWDRVSISSQLVYDDYDLAIETEPGFAPEKFSVYLVNKTPPLILVSVEVGEKCKVGDFIRRVKNMLDIVQQQMQKTVDHDESSFINPPEVFFVINDIFGLFDGKKPIKYMAIDNFEKHPDPYSKSRILMTYIESPGPSNFHIPYQDIVFRDNLI